MLEIFILFTYLRVKACYRCTLSGKYLPYSKEWLWIHLIREKRWCCFINELISGTVEMEKTYSMYFASEGLLYWLKAKDILLCGFVGKCFHVHVVLQSVNAYALFLFLLCVLCCTYVPHHEFQNHLNAGLHVGLY